MKLSDLLAGSLAACIIFGTLAIVEAETKPADKPPTLTEVQLHKFWRTQAEANQAQAVAKQATDTFQATVSELRTICGDKFQLSLDASGEPSCQPKPEVKK